MQHRFEIWLGWLLAVGALIGCGRPDARRDAATLTLVAPRAPEAPRAAEKPVSPEERGRYLVWHVAACIDCHSPRLTPHGKFDPARTLSGNDCFIDVVPTDPAAGCLATANLTNHESGLKNRTDAQIKRMIVEGVRPDGRALHPFMPYPFLANMRDEDVDAVIAYLRTVPGVDHTVARSQAPFLAPKQPAPRVPDAVIPQPRPDYPEREAALRGRYLAGSVGTCLNCHTPRGPKGPDFERAFQGGLKFDRQGLGLGTEYPELIHSANLTPHATGIAEYSVADVVRAVKHGIDKHQPDTSLCPPMPAGPSDAFGGMTDADASDIGHYLLSLPPGDHPLPDCRPNPKPPATTGMTGHFDATRFERPDLKLSEVGLYADVAQKQLAAGFVAYEPAYALFSDGEVKRRWLHLPDGARIDTKNPDHWQFPVGTLLAKEFVRAGRRIETRVIARTGPGANDFFMGAFLWDERESDAKLVLEGVVDAHGSTHDVPSRESCWSCHGGEPGRVLGVSAVQTPKLDAALLSTPRVAFTPPGDARTRAALGYLHANCGHCHNPLGSARPDSDMNLRLSPSDRDPHDTGAYRTALGRSLQAFDAQGQLLRVSPGAPGRSALFLRMQERGNERQMPPLGSERVDREGLAVIRNWIAALPPSGS
jgi:mono/diheme cytochrome c family protein